MSKEILLVRRRKVMLSSDLARLYGVKTKVLLQAVKRNIERFPGDFMFQLTWEETKSLRSQFVTLKEKNEEATRSAPSRGKHIKYLPYAFTEQGVAMLSSVLNSKRAIQVNITIMRIFVKVREILSTHKDLAHKLSNLEKKIGRHETEIQGIFEAIRQLMAPPPEPPRRKIGFHP